MKLFTDKEFREIILEERKKVERELFDDRRITALETKCYELERRISDLEWKIDQEHPVPVNFTSGDVT